MIATAILDRLLHHSHVISIRGESYRLREKKRAGLFGALAPYFADVDTRAGNTVNFGTGTFNGRNAFGVNWPGSWIFQPGHR